MNDRSQCLRLRVVQSMQRIDIKPKASAGCITIQIDWRRRALQLNSRQRGAEQSRDHPGSSSGRPATCTEVAVFRPQLEHHRRLSIEKPLERRIRNPEQFSEELRPSREVCALSFGRHDVELHARPPALPFAKDGKHNSRGEQLEFDDHDSDQQVAGHRMSSWLNGMNPAIGGSGHQMVRVFTSPKPTKYISLMV